MGLHLNTVKDGKSWRLPFHQQDVHKPTLPGHIVSKTCGLRPQHEWPYNEFPASHGEVHSDSSQPIWVVSWNRLTHGIFPFTKTINHPCLDGIFVDFPFAKNHKNQTFSCLDGIFMDFPVHKNHKNQTFWVPPMTMDSPIVFRLGLAERLTHAPQRRLASPWEPPRMAISWRCPEIPEEFWASPKSSSYWSSPSSIKVRKPPHTCRSDMVRWEMDGDG